jgi:hypothetical protein
VAGWVSGEAGRTVRAGKRAGRAAHGFDSISQLMADKRNWLCTAHVAFRVAVHIG